MARGAYIKNGVVVDIFDAACDLDLNYAGGAFVPSDDAQIGDLWDGVKFSFGQSPPSITLLQAKRQLTAMGRRAAFETKIATLGQDALDEWACKPAQGRAGSILVSVATAIGLTPTQIDDFFRAAAKL